MNFSKNIKSKLFKAILQESNPFGDDDDGYINFLSSIWDLESMPSEDNRFPNALRDIWQHTVNNNDWDIEYLFIDRLKLFEDDLVYKKFLENLVDINFRKGEDDIVMFVSLINSFISDDGYKMAIEGFLENGIPIYKIFLKELVDGIPDDVKVNDIPFLVVNDKRDHVERMTSHGPPNRYPAFVLVLNNSWNDLGYVTHYGLFYYNANSEGLYIGKVKIMADGEFNTSDVLPLEFTKLADNFCSLSSFTDYYYSLQSTFPVEYKSILFALRDAAFFPEIEEKFEKKDGFIKSLIRNDSGERNLRQMKYEIDGYEISDFYKFIYNFKPAYSNIPLNVDFNFSNDEEIPSRIFALIGKNGTGKTQLITTLPLLISQKNEACFSPRVPLYSRVIAVSYSIFDRFEIPKKTANFNYVYCGLRKENNDEYSESGLLSRFYSTVKKITSLERIEKWRNLLPTFLEEKIIENIFKINSANRGLEFNHEGFSIIRKQLSSGQSILLYIISEIVAHIRLDALILYDEPETHLHPNAITQLMNTIYELVNEFQSYCIIATHSPLVIRELLSRNVFIIEKDENVASIRKIGIECFGENLSTITEEVFGNKNVQKQSKAIVDKLIQSGRTFEEIIDLIQIDNLPLSINMKLYIRSRINSFNEEH